METDKKETKWNDNIENTLKEIGDACIGYKWMNIFAARRNEKKYNYLMYCSIVLGPLAGILSTFSTDNNTTQIFVTIFSFMSGVFSSIIKFSEFGEKALSYKNVATKYASLETNIRTQLSLAREDRVIPTEYLEWISSAFDDLFSMSPLISEDIYNDWLLFAKQNNLSIPKEIGYSKIAQLTAVKTIEINKDSHSNLDASNLSKYSDGKMQYEMKRFFRMK